MCLAPKLLLNVTHCYS